MKRQNFVNWQYIVQEAILLLLLAYLFIVASTHNGLVNPGILGISAGLFTLIFISQFFIGQSHYVDIEKPLLVLLVIVFLASFLSIDPHRSFTELWLLLIESFLLLTTIRLVQNGWQGELFVKVFLIINSLVMAFSWFEVYQWYSQWLRASQNQWIPSIAFRLSVPNFLGVIFNISLFLSIARIVNTRENLAKILLGLNIVSAVGLLYLTSSRGAWLGTFSGFIVMVFLYIITHPQKIKDNVSWLRKHNIILYLIFFAILCAILFLGWLILLQTIQPTHAPLLQSRAEFWVPAFDSFLEKPFFGTGPYTFVSAYLTHNSVPSRSLFVYAHSIYLDYLSGTGAVGFIAFLWLIFVLCKTLINNYYIETNDIQRSVIMGGIAGLTSFCVHGIADSVHHTIPTSAWIMAIILGAALGKANRDCVTRSYTSIVIGFIVIIIAWINYWMVIPMQKGVDLANNNQWKEAVEFFIQAVERDPYSAVSYQQLGIAYSYLSPKENQTTLDNAIVSLEKTVELDPYWALNHANLGSLYRENNQIELAIEEFQTSVELAPGGVIYWLNLAEVEEVKGDQVLARNAYKQVLDLKPTLINSKYWRTSELRQEVADKYKIDHPGEENKYIDELLLSLQDDRTRASPYLKLIQAYLEVSDYENAQKMINIAKLTYFNNEEQRLELQWYQAELLAASGDYSNAYTIGEETLHAYKMQGIFGHGTFGKLNYAVLMFRRPEIKNDMTSYMTKLPSEECWDEREITLNTWKD